MTDPATNPGQHCDHERICYLYLDANVGTKRKRRCKISPCNYDTRSRPLPAAPETSGCNITYCGIQSGMCAFLPEKQKCPLIKPEATAKTRADVLKDIEIYIHDGLKSCNKSEPWDAGYATCGGDVLNVIKSLRQPQENTGSTGDEKR
jgi:hypothetical protein